MELILWRHAEAEDDAASDDARQLTKRGHKQAKLHGRMAAARGWARTGRSTPARRSARCRRSSRSAASSRCANGSAPRAAADDVLRDGGMARAGRTMSSWWATSRRSARWRRSLLGGARATSRCARAPIWWFATRERDGAPETVLKAVLNPETARGLSYDGASPTEAPMKLTPEQLAQFDRDGYLFFPSLFSPAEMQGAHSTRCRGSTRSAGPRTCARRAARPCAPTSPRTCTASPSRGSRATRAWSSPAMQLFGEPVYMHQFKINGKMAFDGDVWQWHQDYGTWMNDDLMPEARAMNVAIFLDEVNEFNGPLMFIPGSHKQGALPAGHDTSTTSYPLWTIDHDDDHEARGAGRHRGAQGPAGLDDPLPRLPRARLDVEPLAVEPRERVPEPVRGLEPHPPLQAPRVHRAPRLHADRDAARRLPARRTIRWTCRGRTARRHRR